MGNSSGAPIGSVPQISDARAVDTSNSLLRETLRSQRVSGTIGVIVDGVVDKAIPGTMELEIGTSLGTMTGLFLPGLHSANGMGLRCTELPEEGSYVLVYVPPKSSKLCLVLGCIPAMLGRIDASKIKGINKFLHNLGGEPGAGYYGLKSAWTLHQNEERSRRGQSIDANNSRAYDVLPGESMESTAAGAFRALTQYMASIGGGPMSKLECFSLDDLVRITSGMLQHYHAMGETQIYDDEGHSSTEICGSWFTPENYGAEQFGETVKLEPDKQTPEKSQAQFTDPVERATKCRYQIYLGALGNFLSLFLCDPRTGSVEPRLSSGVQPGLLRTTVTADGGIDVRAASSIALERSDAIPVPRRLRQPWDPDGDTVGGSLDSTDNDKFRPMVPLKLPEEHKLARNLTRVDLSSYREAQAYQRFDELPRDFNVPDQDELPAAKDEYGPLKDKADLADHAGKRCGLNLDPDGSFHLWSSGGCEIFGRADGTLILAAPKGIMLQSGGQLVALADDLVMKSRTSADITATMGDIRLASMGNMQLYSKDRGILLRTDSKSMDHGFAEGESGEQCASSGIILQAPKSTVYAEGAKVILQAQWDVVLRCATGFVRIISKSIWGLFESMILAAKGGAGVQASGESALLFGKTAAVAGTASASVLSRGRVHVPKELRDAGTDPASSAVSSVESQAGTYYDSDSWLNSFSDAERKFIQFTYRSTEEYGTKKLKLYETMWQLSLRFNGSFDEWSESDPDSSSSDTWPWPGKDSRNACIVGMNGISSLDKTTGRMKDRSLVRSYSSLGPFFAPRPIDKYIVPKPT